MLRVKSNIIEFHFVFYFFFFHFLLIICVGLSHNKGTMYIKKKKIKYTKYVDIMESHDLIIIKSLLMYLKN